MENKNYQEDLQHIRKMMEKSSRFISLSAISGVFAGLFAFSLRPVFIFEAGVNDKLKALFANVAE